LAQGFPTPPPAFPQQQQPAPQGQPVQQGAANPVCQRLEAQLTSIDRGPTADQIRKYEESSSRQQGELDRAVMTARRQGCESSGFFSLFSGQAPQCTQINNQIQQMRGNLDQMMRSLEQLRAQGGTAQENQKRSVIVALAQNNCGQQYVALARGMQPQQQPQQQSGGFLGALFGAPQQPGAPGQFPDYGAPSGTFRTVCVRTCDGFYFPISFATSQQRFADDERACKTQCPNAEVALYTYRNPGEDINAAVSASTGQLYTALPAAFKYRQEVSPTCSCRGVGQSWADAMKTLDERSTLEQGDVIVTEERAKRMAAPPQGRPNPNANPNAKGGTPAPTPAAATTPAPATPADPNRPIRSVGPVYLPQAQPKN
jgi:hypothetical protein